MAYYNSGYYNDYHGEYNYNYEYSYDSTSIQNSVAYSNSSHNFNDQLFAYHPTPHFSDYDSRIAYSASNFSTPKYIEYNSALYYPVQTQFLVSYSVANSEFNEPEFEEYDPTPYRGGYDPAATYGKPLPPSDEICYPRSTVGPNSLSSNDFSYGSSIVPPSGKEVDVPQVKPPSNGANDHTSGDPDAKPLDLSQVEENKEKHDEDSSYETGNGNELQVEERGTEYGRQVSQVPSGYGLEAMDLCESIFGYWPCLARMNANRGHNDSQEVLDYRVHGNPWKGTADYLFGSSNPYKETRDDYDGGGYANAVYGYQRHYQEQPLYSEVESAEDSWFA